VSDSNGATNSDTEPKLTATARLRAALPPRPLIHAKYGMVDGECVMISPPVYGEPATANCGKRATTDDQLEILTDTNIERSVTQNDEEKAPEIVARPLSPTSVYMQEYFARQEALRVDWQACVEAVLPSDLERLSSYRGYTLEFCRWLKAQAVIGFYHGESWSFPVHSRGSDHQSPVIAAQIKYPGGNWYYRPKGALKGALSGSLLTPSVIGDLANAELILIGESAWDILALLDRLGVHEGNRVAGISTRGASNARLILSEYQVLRDAKAICVRQMDEAGLVWLDDALRYNIGNHWRCNEYEKGILAVGIPEPSNDANEWLTVIDPVYELAPELLKRHHDTFPPYRVPSALTREQLLARLKTAKPHETPKERRKQENRRIAANKPKSTREWEDYDPENDKWRPVDYDVVYAFVAENALEICEEFLCDQGYYDGEHFRLGDFEGSEITGEGSVTVTLEGPYAGICTDWGAGEARRHLFNVLSGIIELPEPSNPRIAELIDKIADPRIYTVTKLEEWSGESLRQLPVAKADAKELEVVGEIVVTETAAEATVEIAAALPEPEPEKRVVVPTKLQEAVADAKDVLRLKDAKLANAKTTLETAKETSKPYYTSQVTTAEIAVEEARLRLTKAERAITNYEIEHAEAETKPYGLEGCIIAALGSVAFDELSDHCGRPLIISETEEDGERIRDLNELFMSSALLRGSDVIYALAHAGFYEYAPETGLWLPRTDASLAADLFDYCKYLFREAQIEQMADQIYNDSDFLTKSIRRQKGVLEDRDAFVNQKKRFAHAANGVIEFDSGEPVLMPFALEYRSLTASPIAYYPQATCPQFEKFLEKFPADDLDALQRLAGQLLIGRNLTQKIFIFEGAGGEGKGTFTGVLTSIIGEQNCSEFRTKHLTERFELYNYMSKSLLIGADVPDNFLTLEGASELKKLVGGDLLKAERKGSSADIQFRGDLNVLITSNAQLLFRLRFDYEAWERRIVLIEFPKLARTKIIDNFAQKLVAEEGSGILNWVVKGAAKLLKDVNELKGFVLSNAQKGRVESRLAASDSVRQFIESEIIKSEGGKLLTDDIIERYETYCHSRGWSPVPDQAVAYKMATALTSIYGAAASNKIKNGSGNNARGYLGVAFAEGHNTEIAERLAIIHQSNG
jgi:P4 family phage/plasmid primase-like protien